MVESADPFRTGNREPLWPYRILKTTEKVRLIPQIHIAHSGQKSYVDPKCNFWNL